MYDNTGQFFAWDENFSCWFLQQGNQSCRKLFALSSANTTKPVFWLYCCSHKYLCTRVLHDFSMRTLVMGLSVSDSMIMVALNAWTDQTKLFNFFVIILFLQVAPKAKIGWTTNSPLPLLHTNPSSFLWNFDCSIFAPHFLPLNFSHILFLPKKLCSIFTIKPNV